MSSKTNLTGPLALIQFAMARKPDFELSDIQSFLRKLSNEIYTSDWPQYRPVLDAIIDRLPEEQRFEAAELVNSNVVMVRGEYSLDKQVETKKFLSGQNRFKASLSLAHSAGYHLERAQSHLKDSGLMDAADLNAMKAEFQTLETKLNGYTNDALADAKKTIETLPEQEQFQATYTLLQSHRTVFLGGDNVTELRGQLVERAKLLDPSGAFETLKNITGADRLNAIDDDTNQQLLGLAYDAIPHRAPENQLNDRVIVYLRAQDKTPLKRKAQRKITDEIKRHEGQARYNLALNVAKNTVRAPLSEKAANLAYEAVGSFPEEEQFSKYSEILSVEGLPKSLTGKVATAANTAIELLPQDKRIQKLVDTGQFKAAVSLASNLPADEKYQTLKSLWEQGQTNHRWELSKKARDAIIGMSQADEMTPDSFLSELANNDGAVS